LTFVAVETMFWTALGALDTTFWAVEVTVCTGFWGCGDPPSELVGCVLPELADGVEVGVLDGAWVGAEEPLEWVGDDPESEGALEPGGVPAGGALEFGVEGLDVPGGVVEPVAAVVVLEPVEAVRVAVDAPVDAPVARGVAPDLVG
jgi:hypothetical protein